MIDGINGTIKAGAVDTFGGTITVS